MLISAVAEAFLSGKVIQIFGWGKVRARMLHNLWSHDHAASTQFPVTPKIDFRKFDSEK